MDLQTVRNFLFSIGINMIINIVFVKPSDTGITISTYAWNIYNKNR